MPKIKTNRIKYPTGWELIEPTLRELEAKMREAENDPHDGKRKCETLWPIFRIAHQKSRYIYDLYHRRSEISKELYEFCLDQGYADRNLIAKWKKDSCINQEKLAAGNDQGMSVFAAYDAYSHGITTLPLHACAESPST
ncbi:G10 protein [Macleaya cordata]|uniref:G10 protein n=1 Tax=Macleaya cordata TaxID=56857 RepID=A0A200R7C4_MACCD|nr:G10 protein [Macleaya cordata]